MATVETTYLQSAREQLLARLSRLEGALQQHPNEQLTELISQVDAALERIDTGHYGECTVCHESVEAERLMIDPLVSICLGCLSPAQRRALESDLELAAQIQRGLLPQPDLTIPGWQVAYHYRPAGVVSGDYCDVIPASDGGLVFLLADVAGKGIAAAMQSANLRAVFRALVPLGLGMEQMMAQASRLFCESTLAAQYATVVAGRVSAAGELEVVNAGHLPVLLAGESGCKAFESTDLPLGMFRDQHFTVAKSRLLAGDMLVLYTDGISEAENQRGDEYGVQSLQSLIDGQDNPCPELLVRACREHIDDFRAGRERADDETLLAIQYQPDGKVASYPAAMITGQGAA